MIPLLHDLSRELVLVFGAGTVGARRAREFANEARVVVVGPAFAADCGEAERVRAAPGPGDVADWVARIEPALVVAATNDPAVNEAVVAAGRDHGALVNRVDRDDPSGPADVVVPATVRADPVVVAIGTGGASPALSGYLRERVAAELGAELADAGAMADLLSELRDELAGRPAEDRHETIRRVVRSERVWKALGNGGANARQVADEIVSEAGGPE